MNPTIGQRDASFWSLVKLAQQATTAIEIDMFGITPLQSGTGTTATRLQTNIADGQKPPFDLTIQSISFKIWYLSHASAVPGNLVTDLIPYMRLKLEVDEQVIESDLSPAFFLEELPLTLLKNAAAGDLNASTGLRWKEKPVNKPITITNAKNIKFKVNFSGIPVADPANADKILFVQLRGIRKS